MTAESRNVLRFKTALWLGAGMTHPSKMEVVAEGRKRRWWRPCPCLLRPKVLLQVSLEEESFWKEEGEASVCRLPCLEAPNRKKVLSDFRYLKFTFFGGEGGTGGRISLRLEMEDLKGLLREGEGVCLIVEGRMNLSIRFRDQEEEEEEEKGEEEVEENEAEAEEEEEDELERLQSASHLPEEEDELERLPSASHLPEEAEEEEEALSSTSHCNCDAERRIQEVKDQFRANAYLLLKVKFIVFFTIIYYHVMVWYLLGDDVY